MDRRGDRGVWGVLKALGGESFSCEGLWACKRDLRECGESVDTASMRFDNGGINVEGGNGG